MIYLVNAGYRQAGPKILSDLVAENERLAQKSTPQAWKPKDGYGVQSLCLTLQFKAN
jgi:hypothetical protein